MRQSFRNTPIEVQTAHAIWVNTMTKAYPDFNPKKWSKNSAYRDARPQLAIKG